MPAYSFQEKSPAYPLIENSTLSASTVGRVDFLSYPFIIAYPFIREVRVSQAYAPNVLNY